MIFSDVSHFVEEHLAEGDTGIVRDADRERMTVGTGALIRLCHEIGIDMSRPFQIEQAGVVGSHCREDRGEVPLDRSKCFGEDWLLCGPDFRMITRSSGGDC